MARLRKAFAPSCRGAGAYRTETALDPLRDREDFRKPLVEIEARPPVEPWK